MTRAPRIDAHQHFWSPARGDYGWLTPALRPLWRDFGPDDLGPLLAAAGLDGTVLVQAAPTVAETEWLLALADARASVLGVVGWIDLENPEHLPHLGRWAGRKLVGLRPMIQDLADDDWMLRPALAPALRTLVERGLAFDALARPRHLGRLLRFAERWPDLRIVLDHAGKPDIASGALAVWERDIRQVARETACVCKVSGLLTEAGPGWRPADLDPVLDVLADAFGPRRLLFGSDWPVLLLASDYAAWFEIAARFAARWPEADRAAFFGGTAAESYRLDLSRFELRPSEGGS